MSATARTSRSRLETVWHTLFLRDLPLEKETSLFILASSLDLFMTCILLHHQVDGGGHFYESNPVAGYFLSGWGLRGLVCYKFILVAFLATLIHYIASERLNAAHRLFCFATLSGCAAVLYSFTLLLGYSALL